MRGWFDLEYDSPQLSREGGSNAPPTFEAAMPVLAVTATASGVLAYFRLKEAMIAFNSKDFPVPVTKIQRRFNSS